VAEQTRAALVATESRLQRLLEHLPDLVFRLRLEPLPILEFVSPSSQSLLGYWPSELVGDGVTSQCIFSDNPSCSHCSTRRFRSAIVEFNSRDVSTRL